MADEKSVFQQIGDAVADYAPSISKVLALTGIGMPAAAAVGAVGALSRAFGLGSDSKPDEVLKAITDDPEIRLKAMVAENDHKAEMGRQENERLKTQLDDLKSARDMHTATGGSEVKWLSYAIIGAFIAMVGATLMGGAKVENVLAGTLVGYLSAKAEQVLAFWFGSNSSSQRKTELLAASTPVQTKKTENTNP